MGGAWTNGRIIDTIPHGKLITCAHLTHTYRVTHSSLFENRVGREAVYVYEVCAVRRKEVFLSTSCLRTERARLKLTSANCCAVFSMCFGI